MLTSRASWTGRAQQRMCLQRLARMSQDVHALHLGCCGVQKAFSGQVLQALLRPHPQLSSPTSPACGISDMPGQVKAQVSASAGSLTQGWAHGLHHWLPLGSRCAGGVQDSRVGEQRPPSPARQQKRGRKCGENWKRNPSRPDQQTKTCRPCVSLGLFRPALVASARLTCH